MDAAHQWLSDNTTGPWSWQESWGNQGHHLDASVYIERFTDQNAFLKEYQEFFRFESQREDSNLENLAVLRGVLPRATAQDNFFVWETEHSGYKKEIIDDAANPKIVRITFTHPVMQKKFVKDWDASFGLEERSFNSFVGAVDGGELLYWFWNNDTVNSMTSRYPEHRIKVPYTDTRKALLKDWGHVFRQDTKDSSVFIANVYPRPPIRPVPADFREYLEGKREDYLAPYADALRPKILPATNKNGAAPVLGGGAA